MFFFGVMLSGLGLFGDKVCSCYTTTCSEIDVALVACRKIFFMKNINFNLVSKTNALKSKTLLESLMQTFRQSFKQV